MAEDVKLVLRYRVEANAPLAYQKPILLMEGDKRANVLQISLFDGEKPVDVTGLTVGGSVLRADGADVAIEGEIDGNVISCVLSEYAYAVAGPFKAFVQLLDSLGDVKRTVLLLAGIVESRGHGPQIDTGKELPSLDDILAQLETMRNVTQAANTAAGSANTAAAAANSAASKATGAANSATTAAGTANAAADRANDAAQNWEEGTAKNAESLGGVPADSYALKTDTAPNASKLGGVAAASYALKTDTVSDAEKLGGKEPGYYLRPMNLLVNSYFIKPVNQRGLTSYDGKGYTIDRWRKETGGAKPIVTVNEGYISLQNTSDTYRYNFQQFFENGTLKSGETYTVNIKYTDGIVFSGMVVMPGESATSKKYVYDSARGINLGIGHGTDCEVFTILLDKNTSVNIEWVALYEGAYNALTPYVPKGYAAELLECQRYFIAFPTYSSYVIPFAHGAATSETAARVELTLPVPMRIDTPSIASDNVTWYLRSVGSSTTATVSVLRAIGNKLVLTATVESGLTSNEQVTLANVGAAGQTLYVGFSAEIGEEG